MSVRRFASAGLAALLAGCASGADRPPPVAVPAAYAQPAPAGVEAAGDAWWTGFGDPALDRLVDRALAANLDVRQAAARVEQARRQVEMARAARGPTLDASGQGSYTRLSENGSFAQIAESFSGGASRAGGASLGLPGAEVTSWQAGFDASWELDLYGGLRRGQEAAEARAQAAEWRLRDAQVLLAAEAARTYLQLRALQARLALAERRVAVEDELQAAVDARTRSGLLTTIDSRRQAQRAAASRAERAALEAERQARLQALSVLIGEAPGRLEGELAAPPKALRDPPLPPAGLPSALLQRRADLRAAERALAAAAAEAGAARADLYPKLSLTGGVSLVSSALEDLVSGDSLQPTAAARLAWPLLDGGRRRAQLGLRRAQQDEAWLAYQAAVLNALKDVEGALSRLAADRARSQQLAAAEAAARDAHETASVRRRAGVTALADALTAESEYLAAADALVQARSQAAQDLVALHKALGGGWSAAPPPHPVIKEAAGERAP